MNEDGKTPATTTARGTGKQTINLEPDGKVLGTPNGPPIYPEGGLDDVLSVHPDGSAVMLPPGVRRGNPAVRVRIPSP